MTEYPLKQKIQIVTIAENQLLLLQFAKIHNGGFQNITGSVENDETFMEAAQRELTEELGISSKLGKLYELDKFFRFVDRWGFNVDEKVFVCHLEKIPQIILSLEHQSFKWVPIEKVLPSDYVFPSNFEAFQTVCKFMEEKKKS